MRIVIGVAALVVALAGGARTADACKAKGKVLLRVTQSPLDGYHDTVPDSSFVIYASGAWGWVQEMPDGQEPASRGGCLKKAHLKELRRALAKAKFAQGEPEMCDAVPEYAIEYAAPTRKKKVTVTMPCGDTADATTRALASCAELAQRDGHVASKELRATCRRVE
jgi:hypothetical protein